MTEAQNIIKALGGRWHGTYGTAPCPICQQEARRDQSALTVSEGARLLMHCKKSGCTFRDIASACGLQLRRKSSSAGQASAPTTNLEKAKCQLAREIWRNARSIQGTLAEKYLRNRNILQSLPGSLRYAPNLWHSPSRQNLPALVARIDGSEGFAISRTYLNAEGTAKANVSRLHQKMRLGSAPGGYVEIASGGGPLFVSEGLETALSLPEMIAPDNARIWAVLGASNLPRVNLPEIPGDLVITPDGDPAGQTAAKALAHRARHLGWTVDIRAAPDGRDWNDVLIDRGAQL